MPIDGHRSQVILKYGIRSALQVWCTVLVNAKRSSSASDSQLVLLRSAYNLFQVCTSFKHIKQIPNQWLHLLGSRNVISTMLEKYDTEFCERYLIGGDWRLVFSL